MPPQKIPFTIREAAESDYPVIDDINRCSWGGGLTTHELREKRHGVIDDKPWSEHITRAVAEHRALPDVTTFVAEADGRVVGYAGALMNRGARAQVGTVSYNAVHPDFRGKGIGRALIIHVIEYLKNNGARVLDVMTLDSDEPVIRLYEKLGFKKLTNFIYFTKDV
jgi:ribosomal protein S18 acetylase RimI-like enzyme